MAISGVVGVIQVSFCSVLGQPFSDWVLQLLTCGFVPRKGLGDESSDLSHVVSRSDESQDPLLGNSTSEEPGEPSNSFEDLSRPQQHQQLDILDLFRTKDLAVKRGVIIVVVTQVGQQLSGINAGT
jgi:hypothetical protein